MALPAPSCCEARSRSPAGTASPPAHSPGPASSPAPSGSRRSTRTSTSSARVPRSATRSRSHLRGTLDPDQLIAVADTVRAAERLFADVRAYPPLAARARFARPPTDVAAAIENAIGPSGEVLDRASARLGSLRTNLRAAQARLQQR